MDKMNEVILVTAGYDHKIHFWEPPSGECRSTLSFTESQVRPVDHVSQGVVLIYAHQTQQRLWSNGC